MSSVKTSAKNSTDAVARVAASRVVKVKRSKKEKSSDKPKRSMARTTGNNIIEVCKDAKIKPFPTAVKLSEDKEVSKSELTKLRDAVNEAAATLREKNKGSLASKFSNQNRLLRRLIRAA